jgi:hypothetical protein
MSENTITAQPSLPARASFKLGVLALLLLALHAVSVRFPNGIELPLSGFFWDALTIVAALAAFVLGILGLVDVRRGAGKVGGRGQAITGLVTATLTLLTPVVSCVLPPILEPITWKPRSANNLKILGLAMHMYYDTYGSFPTAELRDRRLGDRGQPYSWRVALLPFLGAEEENLFYQYRRDEPWDSPANKAVLDYMPGEFAMPGSARAAHGLTHYQVLVGPGTAFERPDLRVKLSDFPRGAEQTILVVEAAVPVPRTKPEDLPYSLDGPLPKVGGLGGGGFHALFADGTVRWIGAEQQESALRTLAPRTSR